MASEWNYNKNNNLQPDQFTVNSGKKVWWICSEGHEWQATIGSRNKGANCPYCFGIYSVKGINDLQTINPTLAKEWNYDKNNGLTPVDVLPNSGKKVWWKCKKGHEWKSIVSNRNRGYGCPYCSRRYAIKGDNDLQSTSPNIAKEWDYEKNSGLTPTDVLSGSFKEVWRKCSNCGGSYLTSIYNRTRGFRCPLCAKPKQKE